MNLLNLEYFLAIIGEQSIRRAAEKLFVSQQSLSEHIKKLEEHYGVALIYRTTPITLTPAGEIFVAGAKKILDINKHIESEISKQNDKGRQKLKVGILSTGVPHFFPDLLSLFRKRSPETELIIIESNAEGGLHRELSGNMDLIIDILPFDHKMEHIMLLEDKVMVVVHNKLLKDLFGESWAEYGKKLEMDGDLSILRDCPFVLSGEGSRFRAIEDNRFKLAGFVPEVKFTTNSTELAFSVCKQGICAAFIPLDITRSVMKIGDDNSTLELGVYPLRSCNDKWDLAIGYSKSAKQSTSARIFIETTREYFVAKYSIQNEVIL